MTDENNMKCVTKGLPGTLRQSLEAQADIVKNAVIKSATYWGTTATTVWQITLKNEQIVVGKIVSLGHQAYRLDGNVSVYFSADLVKYMVPLLKDDR